MTVWAEGMRRVPAVPRDMRMDFFFGFALVCLTGTSISTAIGFVLMGELSRPFAAGLLFMSPIYFVATLTRNARRPIDALALVFGLLLAPVMEAVTPPGLDLVALGLVAGTLAWAIQRQVDLRARA